MFSLLILLLLPAIFPASLTQRHRHPAAAERPEAAPWKDSHLTLQWWCVWTRGWTRERFTGVSLPLLNPERRQGDLKQTRTRTRPQTKPERRKRFRARRTAC
uniref:Putative secreted protein n=1 Tax=Anopheles marajoara TaxID=58244 RepID=A0A2M4C8T5_9DIPT